MLYGNFVEKGYPGGKSRRDTLFFAVSPVHSAGGAIFCAECDNVS